MLFIQATPYPRLYVEVDAVEGMAPDDECLGRLRDFLAAQCAKPAGIQIVRDTVVPRAQACGIAPEALARRHLSGPDQDPNAPPAAFMYVLFFDTALSREPGTNSARNVVGADSRRPEVESIKPHATLLPYPAAILADPLFKGLFRKTTTTTSHLFAPVLQHESGHLLGLGRNLAHTADLHCRKPSCLMHPSHDFLQLLARQGWADTPDSAPVPQLLRLCADCQADVQALALESGPSNRRFVGPVLVRSEEGYHVLALPNRVELIVGEFDERDAWKFLRTVQSEALKPRAANSGRITALVKPEARQNRARLSETLKRAKHDPYDAVREGAKKLR